MFTRRQENLRESESRKEFWKLKDFFCIYFGFYIMKKKPFFEMLFTFVSKVSCCLRNKFLHNISFRMQTVPVTHWLIFAGRNYFTQLEHVALLNSTRQVCYSKTPFPVCWQSLRIWDSSVNEHANAVRVAQSDFWMLFSAYSERIVKKQILVRIQLYCAIIATLVPLRLGKQLLLIISSSHSVITLLQLQVYLPQLISSQRLYVHCTC